MATQSATTTARSPEDEKAACAYYALVRAKIEHEDGLVGQRLTWLLLLQGFLFSAYGFSMSAEGGAMSAKAFDRAPTDAAVAARQAFGDNLTSLREGLVLVGIVSALIALTGVLAAVRAIRDDENGLVNGFCQKGVGGHPLFPNIIGARSTNVLGMVCALGMPFLIFGAWIWIGGLEGNQLQLALGTFGTTLAATLFYVFLRVGLR